MGAIIAGWIAGYAMATISSVALAYVVVSGGGGKFAHDSLAAGTRGPIAAAGIFLVGSLAWTLFGVALGIAWALASFDDWPDALGSSSGPFTFAVLALAWLPVPPLVLLARRYWWVWAGLAASFAGLFGWLMPALAGRWE